jgi:thymidylate synthase (FAD)
LVWATPDADALVAEMARVSNPANERNVATAPRLIAYLIRHRHWSPFEMVNACIEVHTTRDIGRQLLRHRSFAFQEFSQRYAEVGALPEAPLRPARMQDPTNRQASVVCEDKSTAEWWAATQRLARYEAELIYVEALQRGIAKEVARAVLPEGLTPTRLYMNGTIRSWLHFCDLRRGHGTQKEATDIAEAAWCILRETCPVIVEAWETTR